MIASLITLTFRSFLRNLSYSVITMSSLVVGITTAILMFVWVSYELTYNESIPDGDRTFALLTNDLVEGEIRTQEGIGVPMMDFFEHEIPEIESATRIDNVRAVLSIGEKSIQKSGVHADSTFFKVHATTILSGDPHKALTDVHSVAISEKTADLLFGTNDVLGKTIVVDHGNEFIVSAVYATFVDNCDLSYIHFVLPYHSKAVDPDQWVNYDLKLTDAATREKVEKKIDGKLAQALGNEKTTAMLFPIADWRLHWNFVNGKASGGRIVYVVIFSVAGIFVLIMACINYMNIATARATRRSREIGVRKMTGATQRVLIRQFMSESLIFTSIGSVLSLGLAYLFLPVFNQLVNVHLSISLTDPVLWAGLCCISVFTALLAGSYPAFLLSSFKPAVVLRGNLYSGVAGSGLRRALVIFQFSISVVIVFCSLVMWKQTSFLLKKDVGYDKHHIINIWLDGYEKNSLSDIRTSVLTHTAIEAAALSGASPMEINGYAECNRVSSPLPEPLSFYGVNIDENVLSTLKFEIIEGRNFSGDLASDSGRFIITQRAAELLGFENAVGERISYTMYGAEEGEIIGVVRDFQNDDIHIAENPVVFAFGKPQYLANLFVRYQDGKAEEAVNHIKSVFEKVRPGVPVNYSFLDSDFEDQLYRERQLGNISVWFTVIAIIIACLGLFGLVLFTTQRRTKEIGIRKVLGATVRQVTVMLCRDFVSPVLYSLMLAFPIAYYLMQQFLENYPARVTISAGYFGLVGAVLVVLVMITISYQALRAATRNPTEALRINE